MQKVFGLIDSDSFYASCETIFNPKLAGKPVVVLSNSDGCVVARNKEAKALQIKMGVPFFEIRHLIQKAGLIPCSSNYSLYQDISNRIVQIIARNVPFHEVYSIDESFVDLTGIKDVENVCRRIQQEILKHVGMNVGIGVGPNKTLAKINNWASKKWKPKTGGVVVILEPERQNKLLAYADVDEVWGIGRKISERLGHMNITKAIHLAQFDKSTLRKSFNVNVERTARELNGEVCFSLSEGPETKKSIVSSKMFGQRVYELAELRQAVATYTARACSKLRREQQLAGCIQVFIQSSRYDDNPYAQTAVLHLEAPSDDTRNFIEAAQNGLTRIFRQGFAYSKAGVQLTHFVDKAGYMPDLFAKPERRNADRLMGLIDYVNSRNGKGTLRFGTEPVNPVWDSKRDYLSKCFTTDWNDLIKVKTG